VLQPTGWGVSAFVFCCRLGGDLGDKLTLVLHFTIFSCMLKVYGPLGFFILVGGKEAGVLLYKD